ncbi:endonuclease/exonuclease/phosphatase family protein [Parvibium lacunae]|uniref:Endonuclease n=1 Tax=Parvibium lacunae TaxID=1888893 RepID=A0A368KYP2_9BURK|nr:endonuclease/exonuclease/phosphatase family protein [Parvibium lacunae]RCS56548.1 endonuclease [Parvibium lacunae]
MSLRIATYNIHKGLHRSLFDWLVGQNGFRKQVRIHQLAAQLQPLKLDLLFLQEVQGRHDRHALRYPEWPERGIGQHDVLAQALQMHAVYGKNADYLHGDHGNACLSRWPSAMWRNHRLSDHALEQRGMLHTILEVDKRSVHCFVVHLGLLAASRQRQVAALIAEVERSVPSNAPLLIAGDFNDWRNLLSATLRTAIGVTDVYDDAMNRPWDDLNQAMRRHLHLPPLERVARTFPSALPWLRLDRIYQRGFRVQRVQVMAGHQWARLSDHALLLAELAWPGE